MTMTKTMTRVPPWARSAIRVPTVVPFTSEAFCEPVVVGGRRRPGLKIFITSLHYSLRLIDGECAIDLHDPKLFNLDTQVCEGNLTKSLT